MPLCFTWKKAQKPIEAQMDIKCVDGDQIVVHTVTGEDSEQTHIGIWVE